VTPSIYSLFVLGAVLTCILTPLVRNLALQRGFVDCPKRARKVHQLATPRLGGAAILVSFLVVLAISGTTVSQLNIRIWGPQPDLGYLTLGAFGIFIIGFFDDLARLSPKAKLLGEFLIAGLVVWGADLSFTAFEFFSIGIGEFSYWIGFILACLWIVGMSNAINLIDGLDGLATGVTITGLLAVSIVSFLGGNLIVTWTSTLLMGCLLGFLVFNSRPASIFLGDCGSLTLGYLAGCLSLLASFKQDGSINAIFPVLAFAVPALDCLFSICRRLLRGRSPFSPDMEHLHHRLMSKGLSHGKAVLAIWLVSLCCSLVAIAATLGKGDQLFAVFVIFGLGGLILLRYLGYFRLQFIGGSLSNLMEDRKSTKSIQQAVKEAEQIVANSVDLEALEDCLSKAAQGMQFQQATIRLYHEEGRLGSNLGLENPSVGRVISWRDKEQSGYFSRDKEFVAEFPISGRNFAYGNVQYRFMDGRSSLSVQDEVLLERIHDSLANLAGRLRKQDFILS
jgi:UDP-GlcNAc:undecaprenyl-phosphate GlcNAc-1-phosphate transferase